MSLAFLADHCLSTSIIYTLRLNGFQVIRLKEILPINAPDPLVIAKATELDLILISLNGDFADIVEYPPAQYRGIISLQLHDRPFLTRTLMGRLLDYLRVNPDRKHYLGKLLIVEQHRIRTRT